MRVKDITDYIDKNDYYEVVVKFEDEFGSTFKRFVFVRGEEEDYTEFELYDLENMHVSKLDIGSSYICDNCISIHVSETVHETIY